MQSSFIRGVAPVGIVFLAILCPNAVSAVVLYDNFGAGNAYSTTIGNAVTGEFFPGGGFRQAMPFTPLMSATIDSVDVAAYYINIGPNAFTLSLVADDGGLPGTTVLELVNISLGNSTATAFKSVQFVSGALITEGTPYWVVFAPTTAASSSFAAWQNNTTGATGFARSLNNGAWIGIDAPRSAYRVNGTVVVPEAGTLALILPVIGAFLVRRRRK